MKIKIFFNHREELWNAWSHAGGIVMGGIIGVVFLWLCFSHGNGWGTVAVALYLVGMLGSYIASTTYHAVSAWSPWKERLRRWDHAAIYWHIAGSYSPITLLCLRTQGYWGWTMFIGIWLAALVGTVMSFRNLKAHSNLETICFVAMGLSVLVAFKPLADTLPPGSLHWLLAEGGSYITGALFYSLNRRRFMHTVFHFFVLLGSLCHIVAVWKILLHYL